MSLLVGEMARDFEGVQRLVQYRGFQLFREHEPLPGNPCTTDSFIPTVPCDVSHAGMFIRANRVGRELFTVYTSTSYRIHLRQTVETLQCLAEDLIVLEEEICRDMITVARLMFSGGVSRMHAPQRCSSALARDVVLSFFL